MKPYDIAEWFWIAEEDIESAMLLNTSIKSQKTNVYYHCSQAIEKYLKGYLAYNDIIYNKDHNLSLTIKKCVDCDISFSDILQDCNKMTAAIKNLRYPGRIIPTDKDLSFAFALIDRVKKIEPIQKLFNILINEYGENWQEDLFHKSNDDTD
ncbi:MAG: HEPN domain-containing protein [Treponema sp.]|nr:HEPN domain-containing protein [Treponema sp.]